MNGSVYANRAVKAGDTAIHGKERNYLGSMQPKESYNKGVVSTG